MAGHSGPVLQPFLMPAEWERHQATWLAWPHETSDWPGKFETIPWIYGEIVRHLSRSERVRILVQDWEVEDMARSVLEKCHAELPAVEFFRIRTNRGWTRDFCPAFVRDTAGKQAALNWRFNGWAKYENSAADDAATPEIARRLAIPIWTPMSRGKQVVLEGGSIDVNGAGTVLTTEECLLSDTQIRNPGLKRQDYETIFCDCLGAAHTLWLRNGIAGDDTHGHIDDLARFVDATTVVIASELIRRTTISSR